MLRKICTAIVLPNSSSHPVLQFSPDTVYRVDRDIHRTLVRSDPDFENKPKMSSRMLMSVFGVEFVLSRLLPRIEVTGGRKAHELRQKMRERRLLVFSYLAAIKSGATFRTRGRPRAVSVGELSHDPSRIWGCLVSN